MASTDGSSTSVGSGVERAFLSHWRSLPRAGLIPSLPAFLDRPHPGFAPWLNIVDFVSESEMPVRYFGTRLVDSFGEITRLNFLDFLKKDVRPLVAHAHRLVCETPCGWTTLARAITTTGRELVAETITLPLMRRGRASSLVKLTNVIEHLNFRESLVTVDQVTSQHWIDLGAGVPKVSDLPS